LLLLAFDTATPVTAVALLDGKRVLANAEEPSKSHSRTLLPTIERLLIEHHLRRRDIEAVAAGIGPGSFTGVRIGLATAKALAYSLSCPLLGISTLRALAENGRGAEGLEICPALDALKGEVFCARFSGAGADLKMLEPEAAVRPDAWVLKLKESGGKKIFLGTGALRYRGVIEIALGEDAVVPNDPRQHQVRAESIGMLALERLNHGDTDDPRSIEPLYCRLSEAEIGKLMKARPKEG
jgi:tRNA threonylcarbamoyladenosine biosynthesis protein TsaB